MAERMEERAGSGFRYLSWCAESELRYGMEMLRAASEDMVAAGGQV